MATVKEMREGLAAALSSPALQVSPYVLASPTPPAAHIVLSEVGYHQAMGNGVEVYSFVVQTFLAAGLDEAAQLKLDEFIASSYVRAAIEADRTLGGVVQDASVSGMSAYNRVVVEGKEMFSADFEVEVFA